MKRLIAFVLSCLLIFTCTAPAEEVQVPPLSTEDVLKFLAENLKEFLCGEQDGLDVVLTTPEGECISAGFALTENALSVHYAEPDYALALNQDTFCLTDAQGSITVPLTALAAALLESFTGMQAPSLLSSFSPESLKPIAQDLLMLLMACDGITYTFSRPMLSLHIDVDTVLRYLDTVIPDFLLRHASALNTVLSQLTPFIGAEISVDQLTVLWKELQLPAIFTGLTLDAVLFESGDVLTFMGSCMGWSIKAEITEFSFAFALTAPNGTVYAFDTMDLLTIAGILGGLKDYISEEAIRFIRTTDDSKRRSIITTNISVDFTLLERDIRAGLAKLITNNQLSIDALCDKYQPVISLFTGRSYNSRMLLRQLNTSAAILPPWTGTMTIVDNQYDNMTDISAELRDTNEPLALFELHKDNASLDAVLRDADGAFSLMLIGAFDRLNSTCTLSCSEELGGFHSITYATGIRNFYYNPYTIIATDTDVFHYMKDRTDLDLKLGDYDIKYHNSYGDRSVNLCWPGGFLDYSVSAVGMNITSSFGSLSGRSTHHGIKFDGTIMDGYRPTHFSILVDSENRLLIASVMPYRGSSMYLRCQPGRLSILMDEEELVIADAKAQIPDQNTTLITFDNVTLATLVSTVADGDLTMCLYPGASTEDACWTLHIDFDAPAQQLPADAAAVTAEVFLQRLDALITPQPVIPDAQENPQENQQPEMTEMENLSPIPE